MILGLFVVAAALAPAQEAGDVAAADSSRSTRVDESTLLLDGTSTIDGAQAPTVAPFGIWDLLRMLLVLGTVIGVVYGIFYLLTRGNTGRVAQTDSIRLLGAQSLPGNKSVYLVEVGSQVFLIGAGGDSVNLISEITDKETVDEMILRGAQLKDQGRKSFAELVSGVFKGSSDPSVGFMREQRERLARLRQQ